MAKWGFREASGARGILARLGIFCMAGVCIIMGDGLSGLVRLLELCVVVLSAHRRKGYQGL